MLQVACATHFQTERLSALAAAAGQGNASELLAAAKAAHLRRTNGGGTGASSSAAPAAQLQVGVQTVLEAWSAWAVTLRWIHAAARSLNMGHSAGELGVYAAK